MPVHDARKGDTFCLPVISLRQQIFILRKQNLLQFGRSVKQEIVRRLAAAILLRCQHIDTAQTQTGRNGAMDVFIQLKCNAHDSSPCARSLAASGEGPAC